MGGGRGRGIKEGIWEGGGRKRKREGGGTEVVKEGGEGEKVRENDKENTVNTTKF